MPAAPEVKPKGVDAVVTYEGLFAFCMVILGVIAICKKK